MFRRTLLLLLLIGAAESTLGISSAPHALAGAVPSPDNSQCNFPASIPVAPDPVSILVIVRDFMNNTIADVTVMALIVVSSGSLDGGQVTSVSGTTNGLGIVNLTFPNGISGDATIRFEIYGDGIFLCISGTLDTIHTIAYDESFSGDLSSNNGSPTPIGSFEPSRNRVLGATGPVTSDPNDLFSFSIAAGEQLDAVRLLAFTGTVLSIEMYSGTVGIGGSLLGLGLSSLNAANVGSTNLWNSTDPFAGGPLGPGSYSVRVFTAQTGPRKSWDLDFLVSAVVGVSEFGPSRLLSLAQNRPNPARVDPTIRFSVGRAGKATLRVYDMASRVVRTLVSGHVSAGAHAVRWDRTRDDGRRLESGVYFYELRMSGKRLTRNMILLR